MKKWAFMGFFLCLCSTLVVAEDPENKTAFLNLAPNLDQTLYLNTKYTSLFKMEIEDKKPCSPKDTVTVFYNISKNYFLIKEDSFSKEIGCTTSASTGEFTPAETGNYTLCGIVVNSSVSFSSNTSCRGFEVVDTSGISCNISLQFKINESLFYEHGQSIEFKPELNDKSFPFVIEYWIEDLFGEIVKPKFNTTNTNEKSWKTNIQEQDRVLLLKAVAYPSCTDLNSSDNAAEKMFIVTKQETAASSPETEEKVAESTVSIIKISPESASFGEILGAEVEIYKGATDKYSVSVWVEKDGEVISEKTKAHLKNKNTFYKLTLPVQLDLNCNEKIKDGDAQLIVEGLGLQEEKEFTVEGINEKLCPKKDDLKTEKSATKETAKEDKKQTEKTKITNQSISLLSQSKDLQPSLIAGKTQKKEVPGYEGIVVYESVSEKSKNLVSWVLFVAFGLLSLVLIIKKR
ncbi:MAG: hypothetical protein Q7S55_02355 [Nanoarchaeota archaeon]|nr:hypothetical protein [Nanoarchaeota archaeon]